LLSDISEEAAVTGALMIRAKVVITTHVPAATRGEAEAITGSMVGSKASEAIPTKVAAVTAHSGTRLCLDEAREKEEIIRTSILVEV
jgi:hypothetical protein